MKSSIFTKIVELVLSVNAPNLWFPSLLTGISRCYYYGRVYVVGETFDSVDGCNRCLCKEDRVEVCSKKYCAPPTLTPPETTKATTQTNAPTTEQITTKATDAPTTQSSSAPTTSVVSTEALTTVTVGPTTKIPTCNYNGRVYNVGESFKADDGCNTCQCRSNNAIMCTKKACPPTTALPSTAAQTTKPTIVAAARSTAAPQTSTPAVEQTTKYQCIYNGRKYNFGSSFTAIDGCNVCICGQTQVLCSLRACVTTPKATTLKPTAAPTTIKAVAKCTYNGNEYNEGDSFMAIDGCNNCRCTSDGSVGCTKMACPSTPQPTPSNPNTLRPTPAPALNNSPASKCNYNGKQYDIGARFTADDGCNTCTCTGSGVAACTLMMCASTTAQETTVGQTASVKATQPTAPTQCNYNGNYYDIDAVFQAADGCNTCSCASNGAVGCTLMLCPPTTAKPASTVNHLKITLDK